MKRLYPITARDEISRRRGELGKSTKHADLLALIAERDEDAIGVKRDALNAGRRQNARVRSTS